MCGGAQVRAGEHLRTNVDALDNKYQVDQLLGQGGMGAVYRATHLGTKRTSSRDLKPDRAPPALPRHCEPVGKDQLTYCDRHSRSTAKLPHVFQNRSFRLRAVHLDRAYVPLLRRVHRSAAMVAHSGIAAYLKTRKVGGESLRDASDQFEALDIPRSKWQARMKSRWTNTHTPASSRQPIRSAIFPR
jgi:serine/threonine protein kinase